MATYMYGSVRKQSTRGHHSGRLLAVVLWSSALIAASSTTALGQGAWVDFEEDASRIVGGVDPSGRPVINDAPCDSACTDACVAANSCQCACEKDIAVGDLDGSLSGLADLIGASLDSLTLLLFASSP